MYRYSTNGGNWWWNDDGLNPDGYPLNDEPHNALVYFDGTAFKVYDFISGTNGHHWVRWGNSTSSSWYWGDQGTH